MDNLHAFAPYSSFSLDTTQLPGQDGVEPVKMLLCPFDTGTCHGNWERLLVDAYCVLDDSEVHKRDLEDIKWKVAFKHALPASCQFNVGVK